MATFVQTYDFVKGNTNAIQAKILVAIAKAQQVVRDEPALTNNHANRLLWAAKDTEELHDKMLWSVALHSLVQAAGGNPSDADLLTAVTSLIDGFAIGG